MIDFSTYKRIVKFVFSLMWSFKKITFSQKFKEKYRFQYSMIELAGPFNPFKHSRISFKKNRARHGFYRNQNDCKPNLDRNQFQL